jgi:hypothetical protein
MVACLSSIPSLSLREWRVVSASTATCSAYTLPTPIVYHTYKFQALIRNPNCSARLKTVPKLSPRKHASSSLESERPPREPKSATSRAPVDPDPPPTSSLSQSSFSLVHRLRYARFGTGALDFI